MSFGTIWPESASKTRENDVTEFYEKIAIAVAFGDDDLKCPFPHRPPIQREENKIPPEVENSSGRLGRALGSNRIDAASIRPPFECKKGLKADTAGFSPHHLIPGNEIWNDKGHPLHAWIHERVENKVTGDIGYLNDSAINGVDLPSNRKFPASWGSANPSDQRGYAFAAMNAVGEMRQFHDSHKAYSAFVWNVLVKVSKWLDSIEGRAQGCGKKNCPAAKQKPYEPPYGVVGILEKTASRLRNRVVGHKSTWRMPTYTSRFARMYSRNFKNQDRARRQLSKARKLLRTQSK